MNWVFTPPAPSSLPVVGSEARYPIQRVFCVGRNYVEHAKEMGHTGREDPFFFCKAAQSVVAVDNSGSSVMPYPTKTHNLQHEVELVVLLKTGGANLSPDEVAQSIYGYAIGLDMTRRDLQSQAKDLGRPWEFGKSFDASALIGPVHPSNQLLESGAIRLYVNDQLRQEGDINQLIWPVAEAIAYLSQYVTLLPGDVIMTGTPAGVSAVTSGDVMRAEIDGLDSIEVRIN